MDVDKTNKEATNPQDVFLFYFTPDHSEITQDDPLKIQNKIHELSKGTYNVHLVLHSLGGDPYSAAKIINILHANFNKVTVVIPFRAMSAGTLLALGGNEIVMPNMAQIGPLDMQVNHPSSDKLISAFDYTNPIQYLVSLITTTAQEMYIQTRTLSKNKVSSQEAIRIAYRSANQLFEPVIRQIDPIELSRCSRILQVAGEYGKDFLKNYSLDRKFASDKIADIVIRYLTFHYPDHGYGIFNNEAKNLKLNVIDCEKYPHWNKIWDNVSNDIENDISGADVDDKKIISWLDLSKDISK